MRYRKYHWIHVPSGRQGAKEFSQQDGEWTKEVFAKVGHGLAEIDALKLVNLWNRGGDDHDYRYWLEDADAR